MLKKNVTVETSDPVKRTIRLRLKVKVMVEVAFEPRSINLGQLEKDEEALKTALLVARDPEKTKLTGVEIAGEAEGLTAKIIKTEKGQDAVQISYKASKIGTIRHTLKISTTSEKQPVVKLIIRGRVLGNWEVDPRSLSFQEIEEGQEQRARTLRITSRKQTKFRVTKVVDPEGAVVTKLKQTEKGYEVEVRLEKMPEKRRGVIQITTNDPEEPTLETRYSIRQTRSGRRGQRRQRGRPGRPSKSLRSQTKSPQSSRELPSPRKSGN